MSPFYKIFKPNIYIPVYKLHFSWYQEDFPHNGHYKEITIYVLNYTFKHGDIQLLIVEGRMDMQPYVYLKTLMYFTLFLFL